MRKAIAVGWGIYLGIVVLCALIIGLASSLLPQPFTSYIIRSGSMEPTILTGDLILDRVDLKPQVGDVITFTDSRQHVVTHRIIDVITENNQQLFRTKGDNNEDPDSELIPLDQVSGVWIARWQYLGYVAVWLKRPVVFLTVLCLPLMILFTFDALAGSKKPLRR